MYHPDLIAAVKAEALRSYGLVLDDLAAVAALRFIHYPPPFGSRQPAGPEHRAAGEALRWWRVEHELDRPALRVMAGS